MSHTPHDLSVEFPERADAIRALRAADPHFRRLAGEYDDVNQAIHLAESRVVAVSEAEEARLRRLRLALKDQIALLL